MSIEFPKPSSEEHHAQEASPAQEQFVETPPDAAAWKKHWGRSYDADWKKHNVESRIKNLDAEGKIGPVVVDVGAGSWSLTHPLIFSQTDHKLISVDVAAPKLSRHYAEMAVPADIQKLGDNSFATNRKIVEVAHFLDIDPHADPEQVDFIVFSDVLNYVDYQKVLTNLVYHLKVGGRILIANMPRRGIKDLMPDTGVKNNIDLLDLLKKLGLVVEDLSQDDKDIELSELTPGGWIVVLLRKVESQQT